MISTNYFNRRKAKKSTSSPVKNNCDYTGIRWFCLLLVVGDSLTPLSPLQPETWRGHHRFFGWRGELRREGAKPPLIFSPPLKQTDFALLNTNLFERGIKGVSIKNQPYANSINQIGICQNLTLYCIILL
jgi:hypothetical protein